MNTPLKTLAAALLAAAGLAPAGAAPIQWAMGPTFGGVLGHQGILTNGVVVQAINLTGVGGGGTTVVDPGGINLSFTHVNTALFSRSFVEGTNIGDPGWSAIVGTLEWDFGVIDAPNFLSGLTPGQTYQVQFFAGRSDACCANRTQTFGDGVGNVSPAISHAPLVYRSIVGTFVADASTQRIVFTDSFGAPVLNAYVLLENPSPVPEPMSWALMLAGVGALLARRRLQP
jgi:hypothetical protein